MSKLDKPCYDEIALRNLMRAQIETYCEAFDTSAEDLAGRLGISVDEAIVFLKSSEWSLEKTLRVATALGIRVDYRFRSEETSR